MQFESDGTYWLLVILNYGLRNFVVISRFFFVRIDPFLKQPKSNFVSKQP